MNISIIGASGFVGRNLIIYLLKYSNYNICAIDLNIENIKIEDQYKSRVKIIKADVFDYNQIKIALIGTDIAFYLIHMLNHHGNFYYKETEVANTIGKVLSEVNVKKVIYMSGLGNDKDKLSKHLASRHNTGKILCKYLNNVIEFRASMVIGKGSASFEIVKDIIKNAPLILIPKKSLTKTQPIGIEDAILYLTSAIDSLINESIIIEIGGPEIMTYKEFLMKYNIYSKRSIPIIVVPFLPEKMAGWFLNFFTSRNQATIGQNMIKSFQNEMIVTSNKAQILFPEIQPQPIEKSFT